MAKTYFICAGEISGDKLAGSLIRAIKQISPDARFIGITGPEMEASGCESFASIDDLSVMGLTEIFKRLPFFIKLKKRILRYCLDNYIDTYIAIDFTEFNLSVERSLKKHGIRTIHYKSPSVWAWRRGRLKTIRKAVSHMLLLFPFESDIYSKADIQASYIGHPMADEISMDNSTDVAREQLSIPTKQRVIALLPGSRGHEIDSLLPTFLEASRILFKKDPSLHFVLPIASAKYQAKIESHISNYSDLPITLTEGRARDAIIASDLVLLASGTAALETLLLKRKMVVCYRLSKLSYFVLKRLMYIKQYSLPNILADKVIIPELIQHDLTCSNLVNAVETEFARQENDWLPEFIQIHKSLRCDSANTAAKSIVSC